MVFTPINRGDLLLQRYEALEHIGAGGYGVVWKARQASTGQLVAIKALVPSSRGNHAKEVARFQREMQLIAQLSHPHIVNLIDSGIADDRRLIVLEFVDGADLNEVLRRSGPRSPAIARRIVLQVLDALSQAHGMGIIHRDLKPQNIMLTGPEARPNVKVLDFGIAGISDEHKGDDYRTLTEDGMTPGTPAYMSPEQIRTGHTSPESDLYAVGLMLLECLTGERAYTGESVGDICVKQVTEPVPIPPWLLQTALARIIVKACAKDPTARYRSAEQMMADLERLESSGLAPVTLRPPESVVPMGAGLGTGEFSFEDPYRTPDGGHELTGSALPSNRPESSRELVQPRPLSSLPGSGAIETQQAGRRRVLLLGVAVLLLLGSAGAVGYLAARNDSPTPSAHGSEPETEPPVASTAGGVSDGARAAVPASPADAATPTEVVAVTPSEVSGADPAGPDDGALEAPAEDGPAMVSWTIRAVPEAQVVWQGTTLCPATPCEVTLPAARLPVAVELSAAGYLAATLTLPDEGGNVDTQLRRRKRTPSTTRRRREPAAGGDDSGKRIQEFE